METATSTSMEKGKILITVTNDVVFDRRIKRMVDSFSQAGYQVHRVGRLLPGTPATKTGTDITLLKCPFHSGPLFYFWFNLQLIHFALKNHFDLHMAVDADTLLAGAAIHLMKKRKLILDCHEWFEYTPELQHSPLKRWLWSALIRWGGRYAALRLTVSETIATGLEAKYHQPFQVVRNVPLRTNRPAQAKLEPRTLVYLGVLNAGRGIEIAIRALMRLPGYRLKLIGEGDLSGSLRKEVQRLKLSERIEFTGRVLPEDIPGALQGCTFGLLLLDPQSVSYRLSLANKFFDYVQAGLPVLCSDFPEYRTLMDIHKVGWLIRHYSEEDLINTIIRAEDQEEYETVRANCEISTGEWCWEKEEQKLLQLFRKLG